jgi:hypothetical protein
VEVNDLWRWRESGEWRLGLQMETVNVQHIDVGRVLMYGGLVENNACLIERGVEREALVLATLATHVHVIESMQVVEVRMQYVESAAHVACVETHASGLHKHGTDPELQHLCEQRTLLSLPQISE